MSMSKKNKKEIRHKQQGKAYYSEPVVIHSDVDVLKRFVAYIIDWFLSDLAMAFPVILIYSKVFQTTDMKIDLFLLPTPYDVLAGGLAIGIGILYFVGLPYIRHCGQTPGKRICKFKITMEDGKAVSLKALCIRQILGIFFIEGSLLTVSKYIREVVMIGSGVFESMQMLHYIGIFFGIISILLVVITKKRQAIHDKMAKTKVMMCEKG